MNLFIEKKPRDLENRLVVAGGGGRIVMNLNLGLVDANYYI